MTNNDTPRKVGDEVGIDDPKFPGIWIISKLPAARGVNFTLDPKAGGRGLRAPGYMLTDPPAEAPATVGQPFIARPEGLCEGAFVRVAKGGMLRKRGGGTVEPTDLLVVLKEGADKVNVTIAGGLDGAYWRIAPRLLTVVNPADVLK